MCFTFTLKKYLKCIYGDSCEETKKGNRDLSYDHRKKEENRRYFNQELDHVAVRLVVDVLENFERNIVHPRSKIYFFHVVFTFQSDKNRLFFCISSHEEINIP